MRELNAVGTTKVKYVATEENTADLFTKILHRQPFEKHRSAVMNLPAGRMYAKPTETSDAGA